MPMHANEAAVRRPRIDVHQATVVCQLTRPAASVRGHDPRFDHAAISRGIGNTRAGGIPYAHQAPTVFRDPAAAARCEVVNPDITIAGDQHASAVGRQPRVFERTGRNGVDRSAHRPVAIHPTERSARSIVGEVDKRPAARHGVVETPSRDADRPLHVLSDRHCHAGGCQTPGVKGNGHQGFLHTVNEVTFGYVPSVTAAAKNDAALP